MKDAGAHPPRPLHRLAAGPVPPVARRKSGARHGLGGFEERLPPSHDFDCVVTVDQKTKHQQDLTKLPVAVLVLVAPTNRLADLVPLVPALEAALASLSAKTLVEVR